MASTADVVFLVTQADQVTQTSGAGDGSRNNCCLYLATNNLSAGMKGSEMFLKWEIQTAAKRQLRCRLNCNYLREKHSWGQSMCYFHICICWICTFIAEQWETGQKHDGLSPFSELISLPSSPNGMNFTRKLHNNNNKSNSRQIAGEPLVLLI